MRSQTSAAALPLSDRDALDEVEAEARGWGEGDTTTILHEIMPAVRAEAIQRAATGLRTMGSIQASLQYHALLENIVDEIDHAYSLLNVTTEPSEKSSARTDRFGRRLPLWRVWPGDAIENGASEWACSEAKGEWFFPISDDIERSIVTYLARPWMAHPLLDWAFVGGAPLGMAHRWRREREIEHARLARQSIWELLARDPLILDRALKALDQAKGARRLRRYMLRPGWRRSLLPLAVAVVVVLIQPTSYWIVGAAVAAWLVIDHVVWRRSCKSIIKRSAAVIHADAMQKVKAAWLATNAPAFDLDEVAQKVALAQDAGLPVTPVYRALLATVRERRGRVLAVDAPHLMRL